MSRLAVVGVVVTGAVASIATSRLHTYLEASLEDTAVQLSEAHPVANYHLRITATGSGSTSNRQLLIFVDPKEPVATPATVPFLLSATGSVDAKPAARRSDTAVRVDCDALPCSDDVIVRIELQRRADGTWPEPSEWVLSADLDIDVNGNRELPPGTSATVELVP